MIEMVYYRKPHPWCRRKRRVVFNPEVIISPVEKMSITATIVGRGVSYTKKDLLNVLDSMYRARMLATQDSIADNLGCSKRTIQRLMTKTMKTIVNNNNKLIKREEKISKVIEWIDVLSSEGEKLKMRYLKDITNVRDYSILKEAITRYEDQW
jgi:predicted transcriptional regulator